MNSKLEVEIIERELAALFAEYPELAEDEDLRAGMIEGSTEALDVLAKIVGQALEARTLAGGCGITIDALRKRASRLERREEAMRALAMRILIAAGLTKAELPCASVRIRAGTPKVIVTNEDEVPDTYFRVKREIDKSTIRDLLKNGEFIPGVELSNGESVLNVRVS